MPTYINVIDNKVGVYDKGAGYLLDMQWHLESTGGYDPNIPNSGAFVAVAPPYTAWAGTTPGIFSNQHREYHYRFIPIPNPLILNNPPFNSNIPWRLWNTFPLDDTATVATITGSNVVTSDFNVGSTLWDFEYKEFNVQVAEGEVEINADLFGDFTQGDFTLDIIGLVVLTIDRLPVDGTAEETWNWTTRVITSWDSTEQRIRYAPAPRREISFEYDLDESEIVDLQYRLYQSTLSTLAIPLWHYQTYLTSNSAISTNELFFNPSYTNLKAGDRVYIVDQEEATITPVIVTIESLTPTGCIISTNLPRQVDEGWIMMPLQAVFAESPSFNMDSVTGTFRLRGEMVERGRILTRDDISETLTFFDGLPVFTHKTLAGITERYEIEFEDLDNGFGKRERSVIWEQPKLLRSVAARFSHKKELTDFDYATLFFDYCAGQHKPFYISSQLEDLVLNISPSNGSAQLEVNFTRYADVYFNDPTYQQLEIEFADGTAILYSVNTAVAQVGGTTLITLANALPADVETNNITRISYLYRVRLATDQVSVNFQNNRGTFSFAILGTRQ